MAGGARRAERGDGGQAHARSLLCVLCGLCMHPLAEVVPGRSMLKLAGKVGLHAVRKVGDATRPPEGVSECAVDLHARDYNVLAVGGIWGHSEESAHANTCVCMIHLQGPDSFGVRACGGFCRLANLVQDHIVGYVSDADEIGLLAIL